MNDGKEEIELDLPQETVDALEALAVSRNETLDETVEHILRLAIAQHTPAAGTD
jgi:hypothetical protein